MSNKTKITVNKKGQNVYHYNGKAYTLTEELVKGGCQGCAFYQRMDCANVGRATICNKEHKIFIREFEEK